MSERKLAAGYLRLRVKLEAEVVGVGWTEMEMSGGTPWSIGRVADGKWWLWEDAPAECFEAERPKPEVGQWVECMDDTKYRGVVVRVDGQRVILRDPYGPAEASQKYPHWVQPVDSVTPCSPVCTGAQLAIRVGDEVTVAHQWDHHGEVYLLPQTPKVGTVSVVHDIEQTDFGIMVETVDDETHYLWNLEPVKPRA